jgi:GNAT superfamily N-acetyltransferase
MIKHIDFSTILEVWQKNLWPDRKNITPTSNMRFMDTTYIAISNMYIPTFYGYFINDKLVGVNSGHSSSRIHYRSRGLWVDPNYRKQGIGIELLKYTFDLAKKENRIVCWSLPRKESINTYLKVGFEQCSNYFQTETSEHNCYVSKEL